MLVKVRKGMANELEKGMRLANQISGTERMSGVNEHNMCIRRSAT